jgi:hypothetical protein
VPVLVVAGEVVVEEIPELAGSVEIISLGSRFGMERAMADVAGCVREVVGTHLSSRGR